MPGLNAVSKSHSRGAKSQRAQRREQLLSVALTIALESRSGEISMSELAKRAGLSRTSVYEYFSSSSDVISHILIGELERYQSVLDFAIASAESPEAKLEAWIRASLGYITGGDHLLAKGLGTLGRNPELVAIFRRKHHELLQPLAAVFQQMGIRDVERSLQVTQVIVDLAAKKIEALKESSNDDERLQSIEGEISFAIEILSASLPVLKDR
jgi:AcrR family transcriptional regulator